ncbi:DUF948 domain-containing protein [Aerococcaceae bacterium DSM 111020]|nr:DUF948 domain-containing protein [Aerococcaceae bacterium DSM 111020]
MTIGGIAGLIAAIAFAVLVVFLCINLSKLSKVMTDVQETVKRLNTTIDVVTKDVDNLSIEVEGLLNKGNSLVDDVNQKIRKTDPLFTAIGDVGITVSDLTESASDMASNLVSRTSSKKKKSPLDRIVKVSRANKRAKDLSSSDSQKSYPTTSSNYEADLQAVDHTDYYEDPVTTTPETDPVTDYEQEQAVNTLKQFINTEPSTTAGEIRIK